MKRKKKRCKVTEKERNIMHYHILLFLFQLGVALYSYFSKVTTFCSTKKTIIPHTWDNAISQIMLKFMLFLSIYGLEYAEVLYGKLKNSTFEP